MRTANPALSDRVFNKVQAGSGQMTISGTVNKCLLLTVLVFVGALLTWKTSFPAGWNGEQVPQIPMWYYPSIFVGLGLAFAIIFKKNWAPYLAPLYALLEGAILGVLSSLFEYRFPGIVIQAALGTVGVLFSLLLVYRSGLIKVTDNFRLGVVAATGGIALLYLINIVMGFFGTSMPMIHESSVFGIGFSVFVIIIAALNLVLDFDFIEKGSQKGLPKFMEWYAAFGLLITLIWLYIEILRLLSKSRR